MEGTKISQIAFGFVFLFSFFLLTACSAPGGLLGVWELDRQECFFKDNVGIFKDFFQEENKYTLEFKSNNQVVLIYPDRDVSANLFINQVQQEKKETLKCDVLFMGTYSYGSLTGSLDFNFAHDETGAYQTRKGDNCDTNLQIKFKNLPANSHYIGDPSVKVKKVSTEELHLAFPGAPKCKSDRVTFIFKRK